jgi:hypothetical protein
LHTYQGFLKHDQALGLVSQYLSKKLFIKKHEVVFAYIEEWKYLVVSIKKNDENTSRKYHSSIGKTSKRSTSSMGQIWFFKSI